MNRRGFLQMLGLGVAGAIVAPEILLTDPERELWVPGAKTTFDLGAIKPAAMPLPANLADAFKVGDIISIGGTPGTYTVTGVWPHEATFTGTPYVDPMDLVVSGNLILSPQEMSRQTALAFEKIQQHMTFPTDVTFAEYQRFKAKSTRRMR